MRYNYNDGSLKIDLDEELDMKACKTLRTVIDGYIMRYQPREFIIDLSDVKFMDSSGIGLLIGRYKLVTMFRRNCIVNKCQTSCKENIRNVGSFKTNTNRRK